MLVPIELHRWFIRVRRIVGMRRRVALTLIAASSTATVQQQALAALLATLQPSTASATGG